MAQIKTVTTTSGENTITFDSFYPYVWIRNSGDNDITAANYSGASAGDENTVSIKAGEVAMIQAETENVYIIGATTAEIHAQGFAECPFKRVAKGGEQIDVTALNVTENGTYTAPTGKAYSPVVVDVQEQPWAPLQDGYSNFWFELTDDTLSPWLNFSAKNADAVIDWGDGSGEQVLDTLTPTHTYAKAGKYVVKVKGVTGVGQQNVTPYSQGYMQVLRYVELNSNVDTIAANAFLFCTYLERCVMSAVTSIGTSAFMYCVNLKEITLSSGTTIVQTNLFRYCYNLARLELPNTLTTINTQSIQFNALLNALTIPATITTIGAGSINNNAILSEIHVLATVPPTIGTANFSNTASDYIIYVPVGYGETYKAAAGWSAYSDHILEEGEVVTRAMQRKFAKEAKAIEDTGDMR